MDKNLLKKSWAVYNSDATVTLKKGQGQQTWYELVDPKQGINYAMFKRPSLNTVCEKANVKVTVRLENTSVISLEYAQKWKVVVHTFSPSLT